MNTLREMQQGFLGFLLDENQTGIVEQVVSTPQRPAQKRLHYYANGYRLRLKEVLHTDYERLHAYVGDELFERLMDAYIERYPSRFTSLRDYGRYMLDLVRDLEPFSKLTEVAEITQVEQAFNRSFDSPDRDPVTWAHFEQLPPQSWPGLRLEFHDSVQALTQGCNSFEIWQALSEGRPLPEKIEQRAAWVIWRRDLVSRYRSLDETEQRLLESAMSGRDFAQICESLLPSCGDETAQKALSCLQQLTHDGMIVGLDY